MSTASGSRIATRVGGGLIVVLVIALIATMCTGSDDSEPVGIGGSRTTTSSGQPNAVAAFAQTGEPLSVRLSAGSAQNVAAVQPISLVAGTPLSEEAIAAVIDRLPEWILPDNDRLDFNRPAETLTPPRVGETIDLPFPAGTDDEAPEVAAGPLEVLRFQPEGAVDVAPFLSITFNQPMVPLTTVEQLDTLDVPVVMTPELPGRWQWIGTRTLRFEHDQELFDRLPMATEYRIEVPAGTTSENGGELAQTVAWEFSTPPVQVESFYPQSESLPLDPVFLVVFNQRIDPQAVLDTITFAGGGAEHSVRLATSDELAADELISGRVDSLLEGRWLAFKVTETLDVDTGYSIVVGPGTPSAEGPRLTTQPQSFNVRTYAPLRVDD